MPPPTAPSACQSHRPGSLVAAAGLALQVPGAHKCRGAMVDPARSESARHAPIPEERWELLEARVDQLLQRIRPNRGSELRRARVAEYVRSLVARCFKSEVS